MHSCGLFNGDSVELCAPLKQLREEHGPLRKQMDAFREAADTMIQGDPAADLTSAFQSLHTQVREFVNGLDPHSEKEEGVLFPMMAKYIGKETGPIAVMEYEHDQAKSKLRAFLQGADELKEGQQVSGDRAIELARYAAEAQGILTDHFMKEENVLFPMAQQMLSADEKRELEERIASVKV